jgi:glycopeptide antibiotics resistance protein
VGDALYALMIFLGLGFLFPKFSSLKIAAFAVGFCFAIEISQLYHAPWIDAIRDMRLGGLILGFGFLWSDLVCYLVGVALGFFAERITLKP